MNPIFKQLKRALDLGEGIDFVVLEDTLNTLEVGIDVGQDITGESEYSLDTLEEGGDVGQDIPEESDKWSWGK